MTPETYNIKLMQGSTRRIRFKLTNGDGDVIDLQGRRVKLQVRKRYNSPEAEFDLSTDNGAITIGEDNSVEITFSAAATEAVKATDVNPYVWDVQIITGTEPNHAVDTPLRGKFTVLPEVTK